MLRKVIVSVCVALFYLNANASAVLSDTTDDLTGTISARGENLPSEGAAKVFDNNSVTKWLDFSPASSWIQYQYADSKTSVVTEYTLTSANDAQERDPNNWNILGSNNGGASWVTLDTRTGQLFTARFQKRSFSFTNSAGYNIYRLEITKVRGPAPNSVQLAEIELIGTPPAPPVPPAKATSPNPANIAAGVPTTATLSWTAGWGAASHDVYFGTVLNDVNSAERLLGDLNGDGIVDLNDVSLLTQHWLTDPTGTEPYAAVNTDNVVDFFDYALLAQDWMNSAGPVFKGNHDANSFNPGTLAPNTTYYWRVDEVNGPNTVTGDVWSFTAQSGKASNPNPASGATGVAVSATLSWTVGPGAGSHDVYFGTANPPVFQTNQTGTSFNPGALATSTTYYWRINEVGGSVTVTGDVWSFTTQSGKAFSPSPANSVSNVATNATLNWTAGAGAASHDVYFGTTNPPPSIGNRTTTTYTPGTLANGTIYYWRIDEVGSLGTVTGDVWNFTTVPLNSTPVYPYLTWRNNPTNSVVVNWWNSTATGDSSVDYGPTSSYGSTVTVPTITNVHHVELTGLTSGATYHYRVRSSDGTISSDAAFTVAVASPTSFKFAVFGDTQINYDLHRAQSDHMLTKNPLFVMHTGDMAQEGNNQTDWENLYKAEQNLSKSRVIMPTMGNHEVQPGSQPYYYFFDMYADGLAVPDNGMAAYGPRTYSFDYGNTHHIIISSYQINAASEKDWIAADLADANANPNIKWIFAYMHMPLYTAGQWPANKTALALWGPVFDQYHVDIVFAGHNHIYERSYPIKNNVIVSSGNGTIHTTCGLGANPGGPWNSGSPDASFFEKWYTPNKTGATYITINGNSLTAELITVDNAVLDTFTITK